ncbi:MAG TPA: polyprenyl synthetase family protein [Candidatus Baltobacteraceae bacterium]|nr:polyprenyl synthetase family protein [Candidatus Baltobacteraceae bacterium]
MREHALPRPSLSGKMVAYHMGWADEAGRPSALRTGKLVRPSLCLWACCALGGAVAAALPAAAAIEWFHNFTLVHDDIQDEDRKRHGRETVWSLWGVPQAINAGDAMHALAFLSIARDAAHPERAIRAISAIACAGLTVIEGQCLDLELEGQVDTALRAYLRMVAAKTGALLGASTEAGALLAGADEGTAVSFRRAGRLLGTAFQIRDDWLGMYGDPAVTGKSSSGDASRYKMTFPVVAGLRVMSTLQRRRLREIFRARHEDPELKLQALLDEVGCDELTRTAAQRYAAKALNVIARSGVGAEALEAFEEVAYYVATRSR